MANPTGSSLHVDSALTNLSVAYRQSANNFIADVVFPNVPVRFKSDEYYKFNRADWNRDEVTVRAPGTESAGGGFNISTETYTAKVHAFHKDVTDQDRANADPAINLDRAAVDFVMHKMMLAKEIDWASAYFTTGVWGTDITGVASGPSTGETIKWSDTTSGDPIGDIEAAIIAMEEDTGYSPNTMVIGRKVMSALKNHPDIVDRVKYATSTTDNPAKVNERTLAALFGIDRILVSRAVKNTANEGATEASAFVTGSNALLCYAAPAPSLMEPSAGYTFSWTGYLNAGNAMGIATSRFRMDHLKSERIEAEMAYDQKVVSSDLGYFFSAIA